MDRQIVLSDMKRTSFCLAEARPGETHEERDGGFIAGKFQSTAGPLAQREGLGDSAATPIDAETPPAEDSRPSRGFEQVETRPTPIESKQAKRRWKWKLLFAWRSC